MSLASSSPIFAALPAHVPVFRYDEDGDVIMEDATPLVTPPRPERLVVSPPPAPARAPAAAGGPDGGDSPVRNLAEAMAEAVLREEPLSTGEAPAAAGPQSQRLLPLRRAGAWL